MADAPQTLPLRRIIGSQARTTIHGAQSLGCRPLGIAQFAVEVCLRLLGGATVDDAFQKIYHDCQLFVTGLAHEGVFESAMDNGLSLVY